MRLTSKEFRIMTALIAWSAQRDEQFTLDNMANTIYEEAGVTRPKTWRSALAYTLRNLGSKVERQGCRLRRVSRLGRSGKGIYQFKGDFAKFIQEDDQ